MRLWAGILLGTLMAFGVAGCNGKSRPATTLEPITLQVGLGSMTEARLAPVAALMTQEGLVNLAPDGRSVPWLAESWTLSSDRLTWTFNLRANVRFHDGTPLTAQVVADALSEQLPPSLGPYFETIKEIKAVSETKLAVVLRKPSTLLIESIGSLIHPVKSEAGTGPFLESSRTPDSIELHRNEDYYGGKPAIDQIVLRSYQSTRSAWADLLRGRLDMVYEVGTEASQFLKDSKSTRLYTFRRPYAYVIVLNTRRPALSSPAVRRALSAAIDRQTLVTNILGGHGRPADSPIWPDHWAADDTLPKFVYAPASIADQRISINLLYSDSADERMMLLVQQELRAIGVKVNLQLVSVADGRALTMKGDFDAWLIDMGIGPNLFRQQFFWRSGTPYNFGHYENAQLDAAITNIEAATTDAEYKAGVASFQRAIVDDPPAIFLAWSERARAVSSKFDVHVEQGRDVLTTLRLWRSTGVAERPTN